MFAVLHLKELLSLVTPFTDTLFLVCALLMFGSWANDMIANMFQPVLDYFMQITVFRGALGAFKALQH